VNRDQAGLESEREPEERWKAKAILPPPHDENRNQGDRALEKEPEIRSPGLVAGLGGENPAHAGEESRVGSATERRTH